MGKTVYLYGEDGTYGNYAAALRRGGADGATFAKSAGPQPLKPASFSLAWRRSSAA